MTYNITLLLYRYKNITQIMKRSTNINIGSRFKYGSNGMVSEGI